MNGAPLRSEDDDWRMHLSNQGRMITQQDEILGMQKRLVDALEKVASPERTRKVEEGQTTMTESVNNLAAQMSGAQVQLEAAVGKLSSTVFGLMKIPVAVVVVGAASWAFLYSDKISERTWLIMIAISVFPWLSDGIYAILSVIGVKKKDHEQ